MRKVKAFFSRINRQLNDAGHLQKMLKYALFIILSIGAVAYFTRRINIDIWTSESDPYAVLIAWTLISFCIHVVHLQLLHRFVVKSMHANSSTIETSNRENDPGNPVLTALQLEEFDWTAVSQDVVDTQEELIAMNSKNVRRTWVFLLFACLCYVIIPFILAEDILYYFVLFYFLLIALELAFYSSKYRAVGRLFTKQEGDGILGVIEDAFRLIFHPFYARITGLVFAGFLFFQYGLESSGVFLGEYLTCRHHCFTVGLSAVEPLLRPEY